jgi:RNA polymerase sigma-70 factor (ECF subfamily)
MCLLISRNGISAHPRRILAMETSSSLLIKVRDQGDAESWREFVAIYEPLIIGYCRKRGFADDDARDIAQDVFVRLLKALPKFELDHTRGRFRTWLWQVTYSAMIDPKRADRCRGAAERAWQEQRIDPNDRETWRKLARRRVLDCALQKVRANTSARTWDYFEKHLILGQPAASVAAELGKSEGAVYTAASRVLAQVREACAQFMGELDDDGDDLSGGA